jgi:hypothetical protein
VKLISEGLRILFTYWRETKERRQKELKPTARLESGDVKVGHQ